MHRAVAVIALLVPHLAAGQSDTVPIASLQNGAEIRVWAETPRLNGWKLLYLGRDDSTVSLGERPGSARITGFTTRMALSRIHRIEVNAGKVCDPNRVFRKTLKGAVIGGLAGVVLAGSAVLADPHNEGNGYALFVVPQAGALLGGAVGLVNGLRRPTLWKPVRMSPP